MRFRSIFSLTLCCFVALGASDIFGQSQSKRAVMKKQRQLILGPVVDVGRQVSMNDVDHSRWNSLLRKYVDELGGVNYAALQASAADSASLDRYIANLSTASLKQTATAENQKAFWINAYNAVTVKGILQEYPTTSIRNHTSKIGSYNLWKHLLLNVGGAQVSLDAMEHKALRPMGDPRIHFAIVCASEGCPRLLNQAYVGSRLDSQLNANAQQFFSLAQNFQHDVRTRTFKMSTIMKWFGSDFGADQAAQLKAIAPYLPTRDAQAAANANAVSVSYLEYSWKLNEQKSRAMAGSHREMGGRTKPGSQSKENAGSRSR